MKFTENTHPTCLFGPTRLIDFLNCHGCRIFISFEIHCYFCPRIFGYIIWVLASVYSHCLANLIKMLGNTMPKPYSLQILNQWLHQCTSLLYKAIKNCLNLNKLASRVTFKSCLSFYFAPLKSECLFCLWQNLLKEKKEGTKLLCEQIGNPKKI